VINHRDGKDGKPMLIRSSSVVLAMSLILAGAVSSAEGPPAVHANPGLQAPACPADGLRLLGAIGGEMRAVVLRGDLAYAASGTGVEVVDVGAPGLPRRTALARLLPGAGAGAVTDIEVAGSVAFAATSTGGLRVLDIANQPAAREIAEIALPLRCVDDVAVAGGYLYAVCGSRAAVAVVDVSDPTQPVSRGVIALRNYPDGLAIGDGYAFLAINRLPDGQSSGVQVLDLADPARPNPVGWIAMPWLWPVDIAVADHVAYVVTRSESEPGRSSLHLFDVRDPANATPITSFSTVVGRVGVLATIATRVAVVGARAYVVQETTEFRGALGSFSTAYEVIVVDVSDPSHPRAIGRYETPEGLRISDVGVDDDLIVLTVADAPGTGRSDTDPAVAGGLWVLDRGELDWPSALGRHPGIARAERVLVNERFAFVAQGRRGQADRRDEELIGLDVKQQTPWPVQTLHADPITAMEWVSPTRLVAAMLGEDASGTDVRTLSIQTHYVPMVTAWSDRLTLPIEIQDVATRAGIAYVLAAWRPTGTGCPLYVVDVAGSDAARPRQIAELNFPCGRDDDAALALVGDRLYVGSAFGLRVLDVSDPGNPRETGNLAGVATGHLVALRDTLLAVWGGGDYERMLEVIDVRDPDRPLLAGHVDIDLARPFVDGSYVTTLTAADDRLYVALEDGSVRLYDVSAPLHPRLIDVLQTSGRVVDIAVADCQALMAADDGGLLLATLTAGPRPSLREHVYLPIAVERGPTR
jgi:hypothetical protein